MVVVMALLLVGLPTARLMAQEERGSISGLTLASENPGELVVSWETPDPEPTDYRISWARKDLKYLSYRLSNEPDRGNEYPDGQVAQLTLSDLSPGIEYKVRMRARYFNEGDTSPQWSGPWQEAAVTLAGAPEPTPEPTVTPEPTATPESTVTPEPTATPEPTPESTATPEPTPTATPPPAIAMVVPSDALTDRMTQLEVNLTNLPAGRYNVRVTVTTDEEEVAAHDAVLVVSEPPQSSQQQQATESDDPVLPTDSLGLVTVSPGTPTVTQEGAEVLISWTPGVGNVQFYQLAGRITNCQANNAICWGVNSTNGPVTSYRDPGVAPGRTYSYRVRAMYANTRSHFSARTFITTAAVAEGVPMPPSGLTVRYDVPAAAIVLSWTAPDPASDVRNYRFNRCSFTSPTSSEDISCGEMLTGSTDTAYSDTTVEPGHHYIYNRLRAVGDEGDSYTTGYVRTSVPAVGTLTPPTGLTAVHDENAGTATLSWTAPDPSTGLVDYRVLRCRFRLRNEADCTGILTGSTATTYTDTAVSGIRWSGVWYGVKAVTDVGDSFAHYVYLRIE